PRCRVRSSASRRAVPRTPAAGSRALRVVGNTRVDSRRRPAARHIRRDTGRRTRCRNRPVPRRPTDAARPGQPPGPLRGSFPASAAICASLLALLLAVPRERFVESVVAPEEFLAAHEGGCAEDAELHSPLGLPAHCVLRRRRACSLEYDTRLLAEPPQD